MSQYMMRVRVLAQGATVGAILVGVGLTAVRTSQKDNQTSS